MFNPKYCVSRKTKPEHYNIDQIRAFAKATKLNAANMKLSRKEMCIKLKKQKHDISTTNKETTTTNKKPNKRNP